jgi:hypothetical protein
MTLTFGGRQIADVQGNSLIKHDQWRAALWCAWASLCEQSSGLLEETRLLLPSHLRACRDSQWQPRFTPKS